MVWQRIICEVSTNSCQHEHEKHPTHITYQEGWVINTRANTTPSGLYGSNKGFCHGTSVGAISPNVKVAGSIFWNLHRGDRYLKKPAGHSGQRTADSSAFKQEILTRPVHRIIGDSATSIQGPTGYRTSSQRGVSSQTSKHNRSS